MNKSEFKKAVTDSEAPTPGYLYRDMAGWTYVDYATQLQLIKALFDKLHTKNSAFVLYKALHLIKVLCETGHEGFQRELQLSKYTNVVKDFTSYRGPLDIKYGDSWNEKVRGEAHAALEAIFQTRLAAPPSSSGAVGVGGDWSGTGSSSVVDAKAAKGPWGSDQEVVMPSFTTGNPYSTVRGSNNGNYQNSGVNGVGGTAGFGGQQGPGTFGAPSPSFDTMSAHIAEMPSENRWAAQQRAAAFGGFSASSASTSEKPSKTLLQHLASTAKSGVNLITQFEILKGKQERLYGDQFGQAARASALSGGAGEGGSGAAGLLPGRGRGVDEVGSYQPVGLSMPAGGAGTSVSYAVATPASPPPPAQPAPTHEAPPPPSFARFLDPTTGAAAFAAATTDASSFAASSPSLPAPLEEASTPALGRVSVSSSDAAEELLHALARQKQIPSRVDLSNLARTVDDSAAGATADTSTSLQEYGVELASVLSVHLARERPWQERLNALVLLEGLLRGPATAAVRNGVTTFYTRHPYLIQANSVVVQASLKERAAKVAQLLNISAMPSAAAPTVSAPMSNKVPTPAPQGVSPGSQVGLPRSQFEDLLGGAPASPPSAAPSSSSSFSPSPHPSALSASAQPNTAGLFGGDTFEGMTLRTSAAAATSASSATLARGEAPSGIRFGSDGASRPQRRGVASHSSPAATAGGGGEGQMGPNVAATAAAASSLSNPRRDAEAVKSSGKSSIQVVRHTGGPSGGTSQSGQLLTKSNNLDDLFTPASTANSATNVAAAPSQASAASLDDLFGHPNATTVSASAQPSATITTDDLFAQGTSLPAAPSAATSAVQLARIQQLMQYLETRYDPTAMAELEGLILLRQQELQRMSASPNPTEVGAPNTSAVAQAATSHRQFQMGNVATAQLNERQHAKSTFADVQAEMKRQMDL